MVNMKQFLIFLTFMVLSVSANAQSEKDSVKDAVNKLFIAMKTSDTTLLKSAFAEGAILQTIATDKFGKLFVKNETVHAFAAAIGKLVKGDADEQIEFEMIKNDGPLATVWTPYKFYFKGKFSHCGVNSFQMVKVNSEWKIQYLIDTRRKTGCE